MTKVFAFECYADGDVFSFLRTACTLPLVGHHSGSQGEVINDLLNRNRADLGMVDDDPGKPHHALRDKLEVVRANTEVQWRRRGNRHLIVVNPALEESVLRSFERLGFISKLPGTPRELRRLLNQTNRDKHAEFRRELAATHHLARERRVSTFTTELESLVREILTA